MRSFLWVASLVSLIILSSATSARAAEMYVASDQYLSCCLQDAPGTRTVYVYQLFSYGTASVRFKITSDPGMTMTYVSETHPFANTIGNTQTGITVCLDECTPGSILLAEISYMGYGASSNGAIRAIPHPSATTLDWVDCGQEPQSMGSWPLYVNSGVCPGCAPIGHRGDYQLFPGTPTWFNCAALPVAPSTWGAIKALYRD